MNGSIKWVIYWICNEMIFCLKKEWSPLVHGNMDEAGEHYAKFNNTDKSMKNTTWYHLYVELKK